MQSLAELSLSDVSALIRDRQVSPVEVTLGLLDRIEALNGDLNCYLTVARDRAVRQAEALEKMLASDMYLGPLHGIPIALKDNIATAGMRTTAGSRILAEWIPEHDAHVARRLKAAGAVLIGKLHMYEFAAGGVHPDYGDVHNPWDTSRSCGASSSGAGCAVAARIAYGAIGTDTGGSIRIPGSMCGVVAHKPTYGLVSRAGVIPMSHSFDHVGPFGRTARDVALQLQAIAGFDPGDSASVDRGQVDFDRALEATVRGLVVGVPRRQEDESIEPEMLAAYEQALQVLEEQGAILIAVDVPSHSHAGVTLRTISRPEAAEYHRKWMRDRSAEYSEGVRQLVKGGELIPAIEYVHAIRAREELCRQYDELMRTVDVLALPSTPMAAWPVGAKTMLVEGREEVVLVASTHYCTAFNLTGQPAVTVPAGFSSNQLPFAFQVVGRHFDDATVLRVAHAYQQVTSWHLRTPPAAPTLPECLTGA